jgi:uncharacterized protein YdgA (DUF945 family)
MSKRVPIIVIGIVVLLLLAAPYGLGSLAESALTGSISEMESNPALSFEVTDYDRGWFSSRATVEITPGEMYMNAAGSQDPVMQMIMSQISAPFEVELGHGPILTLNGIGIGSYAVRATLDAGTEWVQMAMSTLDIPYVFQLRGQTGFGSGFRFNGDIPPFEFTEQDQTITFAGLDFSGHTNGEEVAFESSSDRLALQSTFMSFSMDGLGLSGEFELLEGAMSLGTGELAVDHFVAINPLLGAEEMFAFEDLAVSASTGLNAAGNIDYGVVYEAASMRVQGSPEVSEIALGLTLTNLDYQAFVQLYEISSQASALADPTMLIFQMLPIFDQIVAAGPGLSIEPATFAMNGGSMEGYLHAAIDPAALPTGQAMDLADPNVLMAAIKADLEMTVAKELLETIVAMSLRGDLAFAMPTASESQLESVAVQQARQTIQAIVDQGMVADDGENYSTTIVYENGVATVNGMPIPLGALGLF